MTVRLIISSQAMPGKAKELAALCKERCLAVQSEPGCIQYETFQSVIDPERFVMLEHWTDKEALAVHLQKTRPPVPASLRTDKGQREDYEYNRTR